MAEKKKKYRMSRKHLNDQISKLVEKAGDSPDAEYIEEMITTALKIGEDDLSRGDIKLINMAMKEMRYGLKVFYPYKHVRKVAVFGSARTPKKDPAYKQAKQFSKEIVKLGWMVITGAASGIMSAGNEGAGRANSFGMNIRLPFEQDSNPWIIDDPKLINFKYFFTRKLIFVSESDATVLCPGGFGTHDEGFETLTLIQTGKTPPRPVVCLDPKGSRYWSSFKKFVQDQLCKKKLIDKTDLGLLHYTHDPLEAAEYITEFYSNYHSSRYIKDHLVFRLKKPLSKEALERVNERFHPILKKGKIRQVHKPLAEEMNEPHTFDLTRLVFYFNRRHFSALNQLIHEINKG